MDSKSQIIGDFRRSGMTFDAAVEAVARWIALEGSTADLQRWCGGITTAALIAGQEAAAHAEYAN